MERGGFFRFVLSFGKMSEGGYDEEKDKGHLLREI